MSSEYSYRVVTGGEENQYERWLGEQTMKVLCPKLRLPEIDLTFIAEDRFGDHIFEHPVNGFCPHNGREIFVRRGLDDHSLVLTVAHELRHCFQHQTGKHCTSKEARERDAFLFEHEIGDLPTTPKEIRRWLLLEEAFDKDPSLREAFDRVDQLMRDRAAATGRKNLMGGLSSSVMEHRMYSTARERVTYIRNLLARLPNTPQYHFQRANLAQELIELAK